jgi:hypothetical protein
MVAPTVNQHESADFITEGDFIGTADFTRP